MHGDNDSNGFSIVFETIFIHFQNLRKQLGSSWSVCCGLHCLKPLNILTENLSKLSFHFSQFFFKKIRFCSFRIESDLMEEITRRTCARKKQRILYVMNQAGISSLQQKNGTFPLWQLTGLRTASTEVCFLPFHSSPVYGTDNFSFSGYNIQVDQYLLLEVRPITPEHVKQGPNGMRATSTPNKGAKSTINCLGLIHSNRKIAFIKSQLVNLYVAKILLNNIE
jgi:hypothetical protein